MSFIIDTLTDLGMSVSDAKTVIIDGLRGPTKSRLLKPLLHSHKQKGTCLRLQGGRGAVDLPFRKQHPYLGVVLSYDKFEQLLSRPESSRAGLTLVVSFRFLGLSVSCRSSDFNSGSLVFSLRAMVLPVRAWRRPSSPGGGKTSSSCPQVAQLDHP